MQVCNGDNAFTQHGFMDDDCLAEQEFRAVDALEQPLQLRCVEAFAHAQQDGPGGKSINGQRQFTRR
ncbi:hypothetical protein D3C80_1090190 [compost metagenome]